MKKLLVLFAALALVFVVSGCAKKEEAPGKEKKEENPVAYVNPEDVLDKIKKKETFAFVIGSETCPACQSYLKNALNDMNEKSDVKLDYIDIFGIEKKQKEFADIQYLIENHLNGKFEATPTTYFMKDGKLKDVIVGAIPYDELLKNHKSLDKEVTKEKVEEKKSDDKK